MDRFLVDSDVIISYTKHRPEALALLSEVALQEQDVRSAVSAITVFEVLQGLRDPDKPLVRRLFGNFVCLDVTGDIAHAAARLVRQQQSQGRSVIMGDALIAATALLHDLALVTCNVRHFEPLGVRLYGETPRAGGIQ